MAFPDRVRIRHDQAPIQPCRASIADPLPRFREWEFQIPPTRNTGLAYLGNRSAARTAGVDVIGSSTALYRRWGFDTRAGTPAPRPSGKWKAPSESGPLQRSCRCLGDKSHIPSTHPHPPACAVFVFEEIKTRAEYTTAAIWRTGRNTTACAKISFRTIPLDLTDSRVTRKREFIPVSVAAGAVYDFAKDTNIALTARYSERAPTARRTQRARIRATPRTRFPRR